MRDPSKMKVVESFVKIEHVYEVREGGIRGDLKPRGAVMGLLLDKNATLNVLFESPEVCQQWIDAMNFLISHKKNLCALSELVASVATPDD